MQVLIYLHWSFINTDNLYF